MSEAASPVLNNQAVYVIPFTDLRMKDVPSVGGKNASLGEMISQLQEKGVRVPGGVRDNVAGISRFSVLQYQWQ